MTGAGARPGLEKMKMPGPGRDRYFFIAGAGPGFIFFLLPEPGFFFIAGAVAGPVSEIFYCRGWAGI